MEMSNKKSIIQQLQNEASNPEISVSDLLRKAKVVCVKLDLKKFLGWIEKELNGYEVKTQEELPVYRILVGETKAWNPFHGWQPVLFENSNIADLLSKRGVGQPIGELDGIAKSKTEGSLFIGFSPENKRQIIEAIRYTTDVKFMVSKNAVVGILDAVRNIILDWSLKLEKEGIIGKGLSFSQEEHQKVHDSRIIYKIGRIEKFEGIIGSISGNVKMNMHQVNTESKEELQNLIDQIKKYAPQISLENGIQRDLEDNLIELDAEIKLKKPRESRVENLLSSIKTILEGVAGNVVAQGIIIGIEKFIG